LSKSAFSITVVLVAFFIETVYDICVGSEFKITVFWDVMLCCQVDRYKCASDLEEPVASIFRVLWKVETACFSKHWYLHTGLHCATSQRVIVGKVLRTHEHHHVLIPLLWLFDGPG